MKDKFEEAITKCRWEDDESGKSGIDEAWAAKECNTLHQQALKDERGKYDLKGIINFAQWYSGMDRGKVHRAYERYLKEKA